MIYITLSAQDAIDAICIERDLYGLSLDVAGGGCAGFEYVWDTIKTYEDVHVNDLVQKTPKGHLVVGFKSRFILEGSEIRYTRGLTGSNFVIDNPNAESGCGCGTSFSVEINSLMVT